MQNSLPVGSANRNFQGRWSGGPHLLMGSDETVRGTASEITQQRGAKASGDHAPKIRSCHRSLCPGGLISNPNRMITIVAPLSSRTRSGEFNVAPATLIKFPAESKMYMSTSDVG